MKTKIIKIGNSKGKKLDKSILEKHNSSEEVELISEKEHIVIIAIEEPRKNWSEAFKKMYEEGDDKLLMDDVFEDEEFEEWS
ncbi:AbrB/MazE/SpoVT family DNA-binding domain-containing protein [Aquiflexum sp.]|uniref:AbrB/MazE/SpoVT family DNA-binding domain-containing protein n=1 Tax=Aquiflexum sp. TaxID=1872584 RepID=UPI0035948CBA